MKKKLFYVVFMIGLLKVEAQVSTFKTIDSLANIGRYKQALILLKNLPEDYLKHKKTASVYETLDNHKLAVTHYEKALRLNDDYSSKIKLGKLYVRLNQKLKAIRLFQELVSQDNENLLAKYQLGKLYLKTNQIRKAKSTFDELIKADDSNANYSYYLGLVYRKLKKNNLRINAFLDAYRKDNEHIKSIEKLAIAFMLLRDKDSSNMFINQGLKVNPTHVNLNKLKINNFYRNKNYSEAIALLKRIDSVEPNEHYTNKMLGKSFFKLNELDSAKVYFSKALNIDKADFKSHIFLGSIYFEEKNFTKASLHYFMATIVGKEARDEAHLGLANIFFEEKKPKRVIEHYKKAIAENGKNFKAQYLLANFSDNYYKDSKIAYKHYKKYLDRFETKDSVFTVNAERRIKEIRKEHFLKGEVLD